VFKGVSQGKYMVNLTEADDTLTAIETSLTLGEDWTIRVPLAGSNLLTVSFLVDGKDAMSSVRLIEASYLSSRRERTIRTKYPDGRSLIEFPGIDAPLVTVQAFDHNDKPTTGWGKFQGGELHVDLVPGDEHFLLSVVDREERPVPDLMIFVTDPERPGFTVWGNTNSNGEAALDGTPRKTVYLDIDHPARGFQAGTPVDASSGSARVLFDPRARFDLRFQDGALPLAGVVCRLLGEDGNPISTLPPTDDQGHTASRPTASGSYRMKATREDCWPVEFLALAGEDGAIQSVQFRRTGTLVLEVVAANGLPVAAHALELTSLEFEARVAQWIAENRVHSAGLVSNGTGRIRIERLPHGPYRWESPASELSAKIEVMPGLTTTVRVQLP
jgi:hypothetical protein